MNRQWESEANEKKWSHSGLDCKVTRHPSAGHLCGYVRIPKEHPLFDINYSSALPLLLQSKLKEVMEKPIGKRGAIDVVCFNPDAPTVGIIFDVHGSITWSGNIKGEDGFWYGFDCSHCDDFVPYLSGTPMNGSVYRDMEYVTRETESLAEQISEIIKEDA